MPQRLQSPRPQTFAHRTDGLAMTKCFSDPMDDASVFLQHLGGFGARGDK